MPTYENKYLSGHLKRNSEAKRGRAFCFLIVLIWNLSGLKKNLPKPEIIRHLKSVNSLFWMVCSKMLPTYKNVAPFENRDLFWTNVFYTLQPDVESKNNGDILSDVKWRYEQMHFRLCSRCSKQKQQTHIIYH